MAVYALHVGFTQLHDPENPLGQRFRALAAQLFSDTIDFNQGFIGAELRVIPDWEGPEAVTLTEYRGDKRIIALGDFDTKRWQQVHGDFNVLYQDLKGDTCTANVSPMILERF